MVFTEVDVDGVGKDGGVRGIGDATGGKLGDSQGGKSMTGSIA
jgi:hypothetical protein